ncbi:hypothetical protein LINGRAHAP2_LOCUS15564 [Linum grandiflorum]
MKETMAFMWKQELLLEIEDLDDGHYLSRFQREVDLRRIINEGPWNFNGSLLILHELQVEENPKLELCPNEGLPVKPTKSPKKQVSLLEGACKQH